jgi:hypothetical protein
MAARPWGELDHYDVEFMDGRVEESRPSLRARLDAERKWPEGARVTDDGKIQLFSPRPAEESTMFLAWWGLDKPGEFESWLEGVRDIREVFRTEDPSVPAAGDDSSAS